MRRGSDGLLPSVPLPDAAWQPMAALLKLDERARREELELNLETAVGRRFKAQVGGA
jgi:hypothetical protein